MTKSNHQVIADVIQEQTWKTDTRNKEHKTTKIDRNNEQHGPY